MLTHLSDAKGQKSEGGEYRTGGKVNCLLHGCFDSDSTSPTLVFGSTQSCEM